MNPLIQFTTNSTTSSYTLHAAVLRTFSKAEAVVPPPDGGYPGGNTAEGQAALLSLTTRRIQYRSRFFFSLRSNTTGSFNTATGAGTLLANTADANTGDWHRGHFSANTTGSNNTANGAFALFSNTEKVTDILPPEIKLFFLNTSGAANRCVRRERARRGTLPASRTRQTGDACALKQRGGALTTRLWVGLRSSSQRDRPRQHRSGPFSWPEHHRERQCLHWR